MSKKNDPFQMLRLEMGRGGGDPASSKLVQALQVSWGPYQRAIRGRIPVAKGWVTYYDRAARLVWAGSILGRTLNSFTDLTRGEGVRFLRWLNGNHPNPTNGGSPDQAIADQRIEKVIAWVVKKRKRVARRAVLLRIVSGRVAKDSTPEDVLGEAA